MPRSWFSPPRFHRCISGILIRCIQSIFLLSVFVTTDAQNFNFTRIPSPQEPNWQIITSIAQDIRGYMWIGSYKGLYRYDGYTYRYFKNDPKDSNSLAGDWVECIFIDPEGIFWIGTRQKGLDRFDPETGIFTHYRHQSNDKNSLSSDKVTAIIQDRNKNLWIGTHGGLNRFDPRSKIFTHYFHDSTNSNSLSDDMVRALYEDKAGKIWIGCGSPWLTENPEKKGGLNCLDTKTGTITRYMHDSKDPTSIADNRVRSIFEDRKGNFWIGTCGKDGLHWLNRATGRFSRFPFNPSHPGQLSRPPLTRPFNEGYQVEDIITFITEDASGIVWIGTLLNGITRYDPATKQAIHTNLISGVEETSTWSVTNSKDGALWISTFLGQQLYRLDPFKKTIPYFNYGFDVNSFFEDSHGNLWLATIAGLIRKDKSGREQKFLNKNDDNTSLTSDDVISIRQGKNGKLWISTIAGLNEFDPVSGICTRYKHDSANKGSLINNVINWIFPDDSVLWIGTRSGLDRLRIQTKTFTHFTNGAQDKNSLSFNYVSCLEKDKSGDLWVGTSRGLDRLEIKSNKFKHYLGAGTTSAPFIISLSKDASGVIWAGTDNGLFRYDASTDDFKKYFSNEPAPINRILHIMEDSENNLWLTCPDAFVKINRERTETSFFGQDFGVHHNSFGSAENYRGADGKLYFGDQSGYYSFFPKAFVTTTKPPVVEITDFRLGNQPVTLGNNSVINNPIHKVNEIKLNHSQNILSFEFVALYYLSPENMKYYYKLENYDPEWREAGGERKAYYYKLPPGKYNFRVKAYGSTGVVGEKTIKIVIRPPWWRTWWAYCVYTLIFIAGVFVVHRLMKQRVIEAEREKTKARELAQAKEIEKAYHELKNTQAQLVQQEKMASLGELTAGIAHEIQNPLNFVNNFSEVNSELIDEANQEIEKGNINEVKTILNDIKDNEHKIIHHGRRADTIVKGMLQHSRASSGQKEPTDINALVDEYLRLAYHGFRAKDKSFNAKYETDFDSSIGKISIVPQDIGRVLLNLINNAFYAVNQKQQQLNGNYDPCISITTKKMNDKVEVKVKDNGSGIPQKVLDKIFQPFFTTKPTGVGTGLGLSLSYDIIKAHGGDIKVESTEGQGAEFLIQLPNA